MNGADHRVNGLAVAFPGRQKHVRGYRTPLTLQWHYLTFVGFYDVP